MRRAAFVEAARRLGVSVDDVERIARSHLGFKDGVVVEEDAFYSAQPADDDARFEDITGPAVLPADLVVSTIDVERDSYEHLAAPMTGADAIVCAIVELARVLEELGSDAHPLLLRQSRALIEDAVLRLDDVRAGADAVSWRPMRELMTGSPAAPGAHVPSPLFADWACDDPSEVYDAAFLWGGRFLVMFPYASVVVDDNGAIVDVFPTCAMRPIGDDERRILFVSGGGPTSRSGYFGAEAHVRDVVERRFVTGDVPSSLPRFVAGTIGDVKWAVVVNVARGEGYRTSPWHVGDQCGATFNSACAGYVYDDAGLFVRRASTGEPVLDARVLDGAAVSSFALREDGAWRFVVTPLEEGGRRIVDQDGRIVRVLDDNVGVAVLSIVGTRLLTTRGTSLHVVDVDTGEAAGPTIDLAPLASALAKPEGDVWQHVLAARGYAAAIANETPASLRSALADTHCDPDRFSDDVLSAAIELARTMPSPLDVRLPVFRR